MSLVYFYIDVTAIFKMRPCIYNKRMLEGTLLSVCSLHWLGNFSLNMVIQIQFFIQIRFLQIVNAETDFRFVSEMILSFSMKIQLFAPNSNLDWMAMDECPFRFAFISGFNLSAKVLAYSNEK